MTTGGVPSVYAGDEFGFRGVKEDTRRRRRRGPTRIHLSPNGCR